jgi:hypothetical protein
MTSPLNKSKATLPKAQDTPWHRPPLLLISSNAQFNLYTDADDNTIKLPPGTFR